MARRRTTATGRREPSADGPLVVYGANAVAELLRSGAPVVRLSLGPGPRAETLAALARERAVRADAATRADLDRLAGSPHHQGAVAVAPPFRYAPLDALRAPTCASALVLDGVQDPRNLGGILRTARALGTGGVVLPRDRSVGITSTVASASAGLLFGLPIVQVPNLVRAMQALKEAGFWLVGLVPRNGIPLGDFDAPARPALVAGGEGQGLRSLVGRTCDFAVSIPMAEGVDSLNVGVAVAIALYALGTRRTGS